MDSSSTVQHVTKASSDQLLRKFAELESDPVRTPRAAQLLRAPVRRKRSRRVVSGLAARDVSLTSASAESSASRRRRSGSVVEWKSLIPASSRRSASLLRNIGIGRPPELRPEQAAGIGFLLAALEKTWRKTVERASKMFVEEHCNGHIRLISDIV